MKLAGNWSNTTDEFVVPNSPNNHPITDPSISTDAAGALGRATQQDDFSIETHPCSGKARTYSSYDEYNPSRPKPDPSVLPEPRLPPWTPFQNRLDFELAAFMRQTGLGASEMDTLLKLVARISATPNEFSLIDSQQVDSLWKLAAGSRKTRVRPIFNVVPVY